MGLIRDAYILCEKLRFSSYELQIKTASMLFETHSHNLIVSLNIYEGEPDGLMQRKKVIYSNRLTA